MWCFSLVVFMIPFLTLIFSSLIMMCLGLDFFGFFLFWVCWTSWICSRFMSFTNLWSFWPFFCKSLLFFFWVQIIQTFLLLSHRSTGSVHFFFFTQLFKNWVTFTHLPTDSWILSSFTFMLLLNQLFFISILKFPFNSSSYFLFLCWCLCLSDVLSVFISTYCSSKIFKN